MAVHNSDLILCSTSGKTCCHILVGKFLEARAKVTELYIMPLYLSTWPFPGALYGVDLLIAIPLLFKKSPTAPDKKDNPLSL